MGKPGLRPTYVSTSPDHLLIPAQSRLTAEPFPEVNIHRWRAFVITLDAHFCLHLLTGTPLA